MSQDDKMKMQEISDQNYTKWQKINDSNYPWYNNLPLQTDNYFVYFDLDKKIFIGKLYPKQSSSISIDSQTASMKTEINLTLIKLGIDTTKYSFDWQITPEP